MVRILVTGERGVGKSTVCERAVGLLEGKGVRCGGVLTKKILDASGSVEEIRVLDLLADPPTERLLARTDRTLNGPRTGAYRFSVEGLEFGREAIERGVVEADVVFCDELGYLELRGDGYRGILEAMLSAATPDLVVVVRSELLEGVLNRLGDVRPTLLEVTRSNRDLLPGKLAGLLGPGG